MHRFLVTGVSGAGKSTLARQLQAWGHHALSADADTALCGQAANAVELADRFDAVLRLEIDQATMATRMRHPARGNDFGRVGASLDVALAGYLPFVAAWRRYGARSVDASRDLATVAENLLLTAAMTVLPPR